VFGAGTRFFRATSGFAELRRWLDLGVNYGGSTVNRHRIEVYLLDSRGDVAASFRRSQWQVDTVLRAVADLVPEDARR
jgi:protein SCO1/2